MLRQFRPSVRLSVTRVYCIKTSERIIEILSRFDRHIILLFRHQGSLRKSEGVTPNWSVKYKGDSDFRPICGYISETVIVTMEDEYKVICALLNSAAFDDLLSDLEPQFQGHSIVQSRMSRKRCMLRPNISSALCVYDGYTVSADNIL